MPAKSSAAEPSRAEPSQAKPSQAAPSQAQSHPIKPIWPAFYTPMPDRPLLATFQPKTQKEKRRKKTRKRKRNEEKKQRKGKEGGKEMRKRPFRQGLATSWHHFTWPPPQHPATQLATGECNVSLRFVLFRFISFHFISFHFISSMIQNSAVSVSWF